MKQRKIKRPDSTALWLRRMDRRQRAIPAVIPGMWHVLDMGERPPPAYPRLPAKGRLRSVRRASNLVSVRQYRLFDGPADDDIPF